MIFFLGTHIPQWLNKVQVPLFISRRRLVEIKKPKEATCPWALDSGGFSELSLFGTWTITPKQYAEEVARWSWQIGGMVFAAQQDWMCEPMILKKTGLSLREHQTRSLDNYDALINLNPNLPWLPVLQGWEELDYLWHLDALRRRYPVSHVGLGSVCRRQGTLEIQGIVERLAKEGVDLHGFGVKTRGLERYAHLLHSSDSMAWSYAARRSEPLPGCRGHKNCANCLSYALQWRERLVGRI